MTNLSFLVMIPSELEVKLHRIWSPETCDGASHHSHNVTLPLILILLNEAIVKVSL